MIYCLCVLCVCVCGRVRGRGRRRVQASMLGVAHDLIDLCDLPSDWRNDGEGLATLLKNHLPESSNLMTSYSAAGR